MGAKATESNTMKPTYSLPPINGKRAPEVYDSRDAAARMVAKMARDAYRDHLADLTILERQCMAKLLHRHDEATATVESEK
jgi:hypothetical protein